MDWLPLTLFPEGALSHSVTTAVWVGVFVIVFFNLRFGWVLSGLVVPGYLAPLLFVKPWAAGVVIGEAIVTYWVVYVFSEVLSRFGYWSSLFGRDRFFALVIVSILVRLVFDVALLPDVAVWVESRFSVSFDFRNNLHSFGLVIICLLANQFWKTGLIRGIGPVALAIALTYLIIRYGLMELTNFSVGTLNYIYEDVAASMLASPKSYIILLITAFIASRMNLFYGWDFNGILIPSLLALQWYQPEKILVSFVEASVILLIAQLLLRTPLFANMNIEGGRKLLLFFNISFAYKLALGWTLPLFLTEAKITDYYGFGYLLPTLMAVKMHDKEIFARITRATLQTSLTAVLIASIIAFALSRISDAGRVASTPLASTDAQPLETRQPLAERIRADTVRLYRHRSLESVNKPLALELDRFRDALRLLDRFVIEPNRVLLVQAAALLAEVNFEVYVHPDWLMLRESEPSMGWGVYVLARHPQRNLALQLPAPLEDGQLPLVGASLFEATGARALALAGTQARLHQNLNPIVTLDRLSFFQAFHRHLRDTDVLQLRGLTETNARVLNRATDVVPAERATSQLWITGALPDSLSLSELERLAGGYQVRFADAPFDNIQRETAADGFAEMFLESASVRRLLYAAVTAREGEQIGEQLTERPAFLAEWLTERIELAPRDSEAYQPPSPEMLTYIDDHVLRPLIEWSTTDTGAELSTEDRQKLRAIDQSASMIGYTLTRLIVPSSGDTLIALAPLDGSAPRYWGALVLRVGDASPHLIEVPRPLAEIGSLEYGSQLFAALRSRALLLAGSHPAANRDGSADVIHPQNRGSLFNLASQAVVRSYARAPLEIVQVRAFADRPGLPTAGVDVLLATGFPAAGDQSEVSNALLSHLESSGLRYRYVDGSLATMGYESHFVLQSRYLEQARRKGFVALWMSREARRAYEFRASNQQLIAQLTSLDVPIFEQSLSTAVVSRRPSSGLDDALRQRLEAYRASMDVVALDATIRHHGLSGLEAIVDPADQQVYLAVGDGPGELNALIYLGEARDATVAGHAATLAEDLEEFKRRRAAWFEIGAQP